MCPCIFNALRLWKFEVIVSNTTVMSEHFVMAILFQTFRIVSKRLIIVHF